APVEAAVEEVVAPAPTPIPKPHLTPVAPAPKPVAAAAPPTGGADLLPRSGLHEHSPAWQEEPPTPPRPFRRASKPERPAREPRRRESSRKFSIDNAHEEHAQQHVEIRPERAREEAPPRAERASARSDRDFRDDRPHASPRAPHFDLEVYAEST